MVVAHAAAVVGGGSLVSVVLGERGSGLVLKHGGMTGVDFGAGLELRRLLCGVGERIRK